MFSALLLVLLTTGTALANKPTVGILGLEVVDASGNIDQATTAVAHDLTEGLRSRAKAGAGPYQLATGSDKELIDEKLIHNCDTEALQCMSDIGKNLGADYLIYGRLEKKPEGYVVTINLLNVGKKKLEKAKSPLTIAQKDTAAVAATARKAYNDLTGAGEVGTLVVSANAQRGTVILDDEPKGNLNSGAATLTNLKEGRYRLAIEADGFQRSAEVVVTIRSGETTTQPVTLVESAKAKRSEMMHTVTGTTSSSESNIWKPILYVSIGVGVAAGGFWGWSYVQEGKKADAAGVEITRWNNAPPQGKVAVKAEPTPSDCGKSEIEEASPSFKKTCTYRGYTKIGIIGVSASVVAIAVSGFLAFRNSGTETQPSPTTAGRHVKRKPAFSLTPVVSAQGGGATFQIDW